MYECKQMKFAWHRNPFCWIYQLTFYQEVTPWCCKSRGRRSALEGCCSFKAYKVGHRLSSTLSSRPKGAQPKSSCSRLPQIFGNLEAAKTLSARSLSVLQSKTGSVVERVQSGRLSSDNQKIRTQSSLQIKFALAFDLTLSWISSPQIYHYFF